MWIGLATLGQPKETNPTLGACFVLDIAQSLLGGSYSRARILPEWLTKNYTTEVVRPNNIYRQLLSLAVREAVPAHEGTAAVSSPPGKPGPG